MRFSGNHVEQQSPQVGLPWRLLAWYTPAVPSWVRTAHAADHPETALRTHNSNLEPSRSAIAICKSA